MRSDTSEATRPREGFRAGEPATGDRPAAVFARAARPWVLPATTSRQRRIEQRQVDLLYPDGRRVVISEWNAVDPKRGTVTRQAPLLTLDQLTTLASAPDWRR